MKREGWRIGGRREGRDGRSRGGGKGWERGKGWWRYLGWAMEGKEKGDSGNNGKKIREGKEMERKGGGSGWKGEDVA